VSLKAKHCGLVVLVLHGQSEDLLVERLGAFEISDDQIDRPDLLLPLSHAASPFASTGPNPSRRSQCHDRFATHDSSVAPTANIVQESRPCLGS